VRLPAGRIAAAFTAACRDEIASPKPGNVHLFADGHRMTADAFIASADAAAGPLSMPAAPVGARILAAVEATLEAVGTNTNLGIILLCAPLAAAAEQEASDLRTALAGVLDGLDRQDTNLAFQAIVRASPAGLGRAERHDVFEPATVTLKEAMGEASHRDRIARQYVTAFEDIFELGEPSLERASGRWPDPRWATLAVYLDFLSAFPDSHIVRKHGAARAEEVRRTALDLNERLRAADAPESLLAHLLAWDASLKERNVNPGTSADLTVATLFAHRLSEYLAVGTQQ
jgi:triphosphoribosyl-dephospho-CoA synthase